VLAVAVAVWYAERYAPPPPPVPYTTSFHSFRI
jgi:hypothetical protein